MDLANLCLGSWDFSLGPVNIPAWRLGTKSFSRLIKPRWGYSEGAVILWALLSQLEKVQELRGRSGIPESHRGRHHLDVGATMLSLVRTEWERTQVLGGWHFPHYFIHLFNSCLLNAYLVSDFKDPKVTKTYLCPQGISSLEEEHWFLNWGLQCGIVSSLMERSSENHGTTERAPNPARGIWAGGCEKFPKRHTEIGHVQRPGTETQQWTSRTAEEVVSWKR